MLNEHDTELFKRVSSSRGLGYFIKGVSRVRGGFAATPQQLEPILINCGIRGEPLYAHINPVVHDNGFKGSRKHVTEWNHVLIDVDPVSSEAKPLRALEIVCERLAHHRILNKNLTIVDSGRGIQAWLWVDDHKINLVDEGEDIERATGRFLRDLDDWLGGREGCRVDSACSDLPRVARWPGSYNSKTGRFASLIKLASEPIWGGTLLNRWRTPPPEPKPIFRWSSNRVNLAMTLPHLTERAQVFIVDGVSSPGRHQAAYAAARSLKEVGIPYERATEWVARGAALCNPPLPVDHAVRAARVAYEKP